MLARGHIRGAYLISSDGVPLETFLNRLVAVLVRYQRLKQRTFTISIRPVLGRGFPQKDIPLLATSVG
jgi:hypothetical protein